MIYFGKKLNSEEALKINLIDEIVENQDQFPVIMEQQLKLINSTGPIGLKSAK